VAIYERCTDDGAVKLKTCRLKDGCKRTPTVESERERERERERNNALCDEYSGVQSRIEIETASSS